MADHVMRRPEGEREHLTQSDEALRRVRQPATSAADRAEHEAASYVRPLPRETRARRRVLAVRGW